MKNMTNRALGVLLTLAIIAPAYGMGALKRGFAGYHARKAVYTTLAARLFNTSTFNQGFKVSQRPATLPAQPTSTQAKSGFFSKWFAAVPFIGWIWQSYEQKWTNDLLAKPAIKDTLTTTIWNPHHPDIDAYVLGKCINTYKMGPKECGESVIKVKALLEQERLNRLDKLDKARLKQLEKLEKQDRIDTSITATEFTKGAMQLGCRNDKGLPVSLTQASDEQLKDTLRQVDDKFFSAKCKDKNKQAMCDAARELSFKQLRLFRDAATTPAKVQATTTQKK